MRKSPPTMVPGLTSCTVATRYRGPPGASTARRTAHPPALSGTRAAVARFVVDVVQTRVKVCAAAQGALNGRRV